MRKRNLIILLAVVILILLAVAYVILSFVRSQLYYATDGGARVGSESWELTSPLTAKKMPFGMGLATTSEERATSRREVGGQAQESSDRLVIKKAILNMVVKDVAATLGAIKNYIEEKGGWVVSSSLTNPQEEARGRIEVRIPAQVFDESLGKFKAYGVKITSEYVSGEDVTEEYTDLGAQLKNLERAEEQFLKIMERSGGIPDVLAVQREVNNVRGQIEKTKGRMQYLEQSVAHSSITINLALEEGALPLVTPATKWQPKVVLKVAFRSLILFLQKLSYLMIWLVVYAVIWVPLLLLVIWALKRWWRGRSQM